MLEARDLDVRRGGRLALQQADLVLRSGELLAVCGPNGAGKSTLFSALTGEIAPNGGAVLLDGQPIAGRGAAALARERAALEQDPMLSAAFTVAELVALGLSAVPRADLDARALSDRAMAAAGIAGLAQRRADRLSGGERARAHLARILAQLWAGRAAGGGRYLLLDEPVASLDLAHQVALMHVARAEAAAGAGVLVVLHDLNLVAGFADRVVLLSEGRIVADGRTEDVFDAGRLGAIYGTRIEVTRRGDGRLAILPVIDAA